MAEEALIRDVVMRYKAGMEAERIRQQAATAPEPGLTAPSAVQDPPAGASGRPDRPEGHTEALAERVALIDRMANRMVEDMDEREARGDCDDEYDKHAESVLDSLAAEGRLCGPGQLEEFRASWTRAQDQCEEALNQRDAMSTRLALAAAESRVVVTDLRREIRDRSQACARLTREIDRLRDWGDARLARLAELRQLLAEARVDRLMGARITTGSLPVGSDPDRYTSGCVDHGDHSFPRCLTCGATACCVHCLPVSSSRHVGGLT